MPLRPRATPQGCPIAPMVLAISSPAGLRRVENSQQSGARVRHFICMDDRPLHCKHLQGISDAIKAWHHWLEKMGFPESPEKTRVCGKSFKKKSKLASLKGTLTGHKPTNTTRENWIC